MSRLKLKNRFFNAGGANAQLTCPALNGSSSTLGTTLTGTGYQPGTFPSNGTLSFWLTPMFKSGDSYIFGDGGTNKLCIQIRSLASNSSGRSQIRIQLRGPSGNIYAQDIYVPNSQESLLQIRWETSVGTAIKFTAVLNGSVVMTYGPLNSAWRVTEQIFRFGGDYCRCIFGDIQLYNRYLTDEELTVVGTLRTVAGLVDRWKFDDPQLGLDAQYVKSSIGTAVSLLIGDYSGNSDPRGMDRNFSITGLGFSFRLADEIPVFSGSRTLTPEFFGQTNLYYPTGTTTPNTNVKYGTVRTHDWKATGTTISANVTTTTGSKNATVSSTTNLKPGMVVFGNANIAAGITIESITSSTAIVLSSAAGSPGTSVATSFRDEIPNACAWRYLQSAPGAQFDFTYADQFVAAHTGRDIIWVLGFPADGFVAGAASASAGYYSPLTEANRAQSKANQPPDSNDAWVAYVTAVATRYAGKVKYFEIWNEPESPDFWSGPNATPARLAELMRLASVAVKAVDPTNCIISPPCSGWFPSSWAATPGTADCPGLTWTRNILSASDGAGGFGKQWCDKVGMHLYHRISNLGNIDLSVDGFYGIRELLKTLGIGNKPIWADEIGVAGPTDADHFFALPLRQRKKVLQRTMILTAASSLERMAWYSYDANKTGFYGNAGIEQAWIEMRQILLSGPITSVTKLASGAVTVTVGDVQYIV